MDKSIFWDINEPLSYNCIINIIMGNRGGGKSYGVKEYAVEKTVFKNKKKFVYLRRYKEELKDSAKTFFNDLAENGVTRGLECKYEGGKFLIENNVVGYGFSLSTAKTKKSMSFPDVEVIIYDEFIVDPNDYFQRYLPTEVDSFLNFYETIARLRPVKVFMLGNTLSYTSPYFLKWGIEKPTNKKLIRTFHNNFILLQLVQKESFIKVKKATRFGRFLEGTKEGSYMVDNNVLRDNDNLVEVKPSSAKYLFTLITNHKNYGVWYTNDMSIWVSSKYDSKWKYMLTTDRELHTSKTIYIKSVSDNSLFTIFVKAFKQGRLSFDSIKIKNVVIDSVKNLK